MAADMGRLIEAQKAFKTFSDEFVIPTLDISEYEREKLGFADIARLIEDDQIREKYVDLAINLLDANIAQYGPEAFQHIPEYNDSIVVSSTLLAAALTLYSDGGPITALVVSAIWYWLASKAEHERYQRNAASIREDNERLQEWTDAVAAWGKARDALEGLDDPPLSGSEGIQGA